MSDTNKTRERCMIEYARRNYDDHGTWTAWIGCAFGAHQGFGGFCLDREQSGPTPLLDAFERDVCAIFGATKFDDIVGRECFILRAEDTWGAAIEGLECDGRRFTHRTWRRKMLPDVAVPTALACEKDHLLNSIAGNTRRIGEMTERLRTLDERFVDWDVMP